MVETFRRVDVALSNLNTALRLYFETQEYFAVVVLAGAADEILGQQLRFHGQEPALDALSKGAVGFAALLGQKATLKDMHKVANRARNQTKHMDGPDDALVTLDPKEDAKALLERAVDNFYDLLLLEELEETPLIRRFNDDETSSG